MSDTCYQRFTNGIDKRTVNALLKEILARDYTVSIYDGEEWTLKNSTNITEIKADLATTGEDVIAIKKGDKDYGSFSLIYNNGDEYMETISDYTSNEFCDAIYNAIEK